MRVLFVTKYGPRAASSRTRVFQYLPHLRAHGVDCEVLTVLPDEALGGSQLAASRRPLAKALYYLGAAWRNAACGLRAWRRARGADALFLQKVIFPAPVRWLIHRTGVPVVYDFDDAIFTTETGGRSGGLLARWRQRRACAGLPAMLRLARLAVVENPYTGEFAGRYGPVLTITGPIDPAPFAGIRRDGGTGPVVLGWIGSASTAGYLELIAEPLRRVARQEPVRVCVVGAEWSLDGVEVECRPWSLEREAEDLGGWEVGLMPLPDDPWTRGKGGYKLLQYMAAALPVVAHPVGVNGEIVADGETGLLAADEAAWESALLRLVRDPALRRAFGERGRQRVEDRYGLAVHAPRLLAMLRQLGGSR
ncbi:MAG: glycosyltransferase family 4 protein [Gemmatimonadaceae bacterium]|nr:glycosyltransferase family 4 protein [Gemmatimonadaceae bacterium]